MAVIAQQDIDAACRLLQRIYTPAETSLPMMVSGTTVPPIPSCFKDPQHPISQELVSAINQTMVAVTTVTIVNEWQFNPGQVDNLAPCDPRIADLRQKISSEIAKIPLVARLRHQRVQRIG